MFSEEIVLNSHFLGATGIEELRWLSPVRPGDTVTGRVTVMEVCVTLGQLTPEAARQLIEESAQALADKFGSENVSAEVIEGYIKDRILETAKSWPAHLIVCGSHGRKGFTKFLLGSVSEAIVAHSPCSIEIVKIAHQPDSGQT